MKINRVKLLLSYIKKHRKAFVLFCIFSGIYAIIFYLYHIPTEPIIYASGLFLIILALFVLYDSTRYYMKHKQLLSLHEKICIDLDGLPLPKDIIEEDYQYLMALIHKDKIKLISEYDTAQTSMTEYYTMWVHQIKTPISAMHLLLQSDDSALSNDLLAELFKTEQYVDMVLQYIRLNSTSNDFLFRYYSLDDIIKAAIRKYAKIFIKKKIAMHFQETKHQVLTDEKWLLFIIEQLLSNALKYTNKGSISIYMIQSETLVIEDTGIGIQPEDIPRVCEQGYTGYNGRGNQKSTGIGLFLTKKIIDTLGHALTIESELNQGTKIKIGFKNTKQTNES